MFVRDGARRLPHPAMTPRLMTGLQYELHPRNKNLVFWPRILVMPSRTDVTSHRQEGAVVRGSPRDGLLGGVSGPWMQPSETPPAGLFVFESQR